MTIPIAHGSFPPMITPMTADASGIDPVGIEALINWHIDAGTTGAFVVCGTGEMFRLTPDEMVEVVDAAVKASAGRIPVVAGLPFPSVEQRHALAKRYEEVGASGAVALQPWEEEYNDDAWYEHYMKIAEGVDIPFMIYEHPKWNDTLLTPSLVGRLASSGRYVGMKDCTGDLGRLAAMAKAGEGRFGVMQAVQERLLSAILCGGTGACATASNAGPALYRRVYDLVQEGKILEAWDAQKKIRELVPMYGKAGGGNGTKHMLNKMGLPIHTSWRSGKELTEEQITAGDALIAFLQKVI